MHEQEIADRRRDAQAQRRQLFGQPWQPCIVEGNSLVDMRTVADSGGTGRYGGGVQVERPADSVDRVDDMRRPWIFEKVRVITTFSNDETSSIPAS